MQTKYVVLGLVGLVALLASPVQAETFAEALATAYRSNPALAADRAKLRAVDEQIAEAESGFRPSVDAVASAGKAYQNPPLMAGGDVDLSPRGAGVQFKQPLFRGFRTLGAVRAAKATVQAQQAMLQAAEQNLLLTAGTAYLDVLRDEAVLGLTRGNEEVLRKQMEATRDRFKVGEVTQTDVSQAASRLERATAARIQAEGALAATRATYARVVGDSPGTLTSPKLDLAEPKDQDEAVRRAEKDNPTVQAASFAIDAARENVTVAEGALLPELNLVGSASRGWDQSVMVTGRQDSSQIMAQVTIPLYRGGADYARTRAAKQTTAQMRLQQLDARNRAREGAVQAWQGLVTARAAILSDKAQVEAADMAYRGVKEESKVGTRTVLDELNASQEALDAKVALVKAERDEGVAILRTRAAVGTLTAAALALPVNLYDPTRHADEVSGKWAGFGDDDEKTVTR
jgi:TolC family type I secretion outer membrane protein